MPTSAHKYHQPTAPSINIPAQTWLETEVHMLLVGGYREVDGRSHGGEPPLRSRTEPIREINSARVGSIRAETPLLTSRPSDVHDASTPRMRRSSKYRARQPRFVDARSLDVRWSVVAVWFQREMRQLNSPSAVSRRCAEP